MTEDEIRELLREMRETPVPADSLVRVRLGLEDRMRRRARWKYVWWVLAAATVLLSALLFQPSATVRKPAGAKVVARQPEAPPMELPAPAARLTVRPAIIRKVRRPEKAPDPVVIRIETPDPDVVILLVGE